MLKSLVLIGGRGKAGGILKARDSKEACEILPGMIGKKIHGYPVHSVLIEEAVESRGAYYLAVTMNPATYNPIVLASASGGVEIETVARENPEAILKMELTQNESELPDASADRLTDFLLSGREQNLRKSLRKVIRSLYALFQKYDCKIAEINPLLLTDSGFVAADAKIVLDDNALYRQGNLLSTLGIGSVRHEVSEPTKNELRARAAGFAYVDLLPEDHRKDNEKLYVGLVPGGAGYGIFSIDEVANVGDRFFQGRVIPVNFMDSGGGPTLERVAEMFHLLMDCEPVDIVITSRFGGISSCDTYIRGLVECLKMRHSHGKRIVPVHGRMVGTDLPSARDFLEKSRRQHPELMRNLTMVVGNQEIMADVIRRGIQAAFEMKGWA